jgi:hypothetical protein
MKAAFTALVAIFCLGTSWAQQPDAPAQSAPHVVKKAVPNVEILRVLLEREKAIKGSFKHAGTRQHPKTIFQPAQYERLLHDISADRCPEKFQVAWMDYQLAWRTHVKQTQKKAFEFAIEVASEVATGGLSTMAAIADAKTLSKPVEDTYPAWIKVKEEAILHHIHFPEKYADL